jgi:hypothetical protein
MSKKIYVTMWVLVLKIEILICCGFETWSFTERQKITIELESSIKKYTIKRSDG